MKTFEENYTGWVDGKLHGAELAAFEQELGSLGEASADKRSAAGLGALLRLHCRAPELNNPEFFNHQLLQRIESEGPVRKEAQIQKAFWARWSFAQVAWSGLASLLVAGAMFELMIPPKNPAPPSYFAQIVDARSLDKNISVSTVYSPKDNLTLLWVDGLDYLPDSYKLQ